MGLPSFSSQIARQTRQNVPLKAGLRSRYTEPSGPRMKLEKLLRELPEDLTPADRELIQRAYQVAEQAHAGQTRASGEPYVTHCVAVAAILAELDAPVPVDRRRPAARHRRRHAGHARSNPEGLRARKSPRWWTASRSSRSSPG